MNKVILRKVFLDAIERGMEFTSMITSGCDLCVPIANLGSINNYRDATDSDKETLIRWVDELLDSYQEHVEIDDLVEALTTSVKHSLSVLTNLKSDVDDIVKATNSDIAKALSEDMRYQKHIASQTPPRYAIYNLYEFVMLAGGKDAVRKAVVDYVIDNAKDLTLSDEFNMVSGRYATRIMDEVSLTDTKLETADKIDLVTKINAKLTNSDRDSVKEVVDFITNKSRLTAKLKRVSDEMVKLGADQYMETVQAYGQFIDQYMPVINVIATDAPAFAMSIEDNMKMIKSIIKLMAYIIDYRSETIYKDTVLFPNKTINGKMEREAIAAGIDSNYLYWHVQQFYTEYDMGNSGITMGEIQRQRTRVIEVQDRNNREDAQYTELLCGEVRVLSAARQLALYLESKSYGFKKHDLISKCGALKDKDLPLDSLLYPALIEMFHEDTVVEELYEQLGTSYIKLLQEQGDDYADKLNETNMLAYTKVVADILNDVLVENEQKM